MTDAILQSELPISPWLDPALWRLPGMKALDPARWLLRDDAFDGQMKLRDHLLKTARAEVYAVEPMAHEAALECLDLVLTECQRDDQYLIGPHQVRRPDVVTVPLDRTAPLLTIGRLIQEDICILQKGSDAEHRLTGAVLCFPASWTLDEKIGRPLTRIHTPVESYDTDVAHRVQRMFDRLRSDTPMWRANALLYDSPDLFQPRRENDDARELSGNGKYLRSERQTLRRLPETGAIIFAIHTFVVEIEHLTRAQMAALHLVAERHYLTSEHPK